MLVLTVQCSFRKLRKNLIVFDSLQVLMLRLLGGIELENGILILEHIGEYINSSHQLNKSSLRL